MSKSANPGFDFDNRPDRNNTRIQENTDSQDDVDSYLMDSVDNDLDFGSASGTSSIDSQSTVNDSVTFVGEPGLEFGSDLEYGLTNTYALVDGTSGINEAFNKTLRDASTLVPQDVSAGSDKNGNFKELSVFGQNGDSLKSRIYEDGKGRVTAGGRTEEFDYSSADKIYQATRGKNGGLAGEPVSSITNFDMPNQHFNKLETLGSGMQRIEMSNGDVLYRPPQNPDGVKWIRAVGGDQGDYSIVAYADGSKDLRFSDPARAQGIESARFDQFGQLVSIQKDKAAPNMVVPDFTNVEDPADLDPIPPINLDRMLGFSADPRSGPVGEQANRYLTGDEEQRAEAVEQLTKEAEGGNKEAKNALDTLEIRRRLESGMRLLNVFPSQGPMPPADRLNWIARNQSLPKGPFIDRGHETIGLIVDHYNFAGNQAERKQALDLMRREVQLGDPSAVMALKQLTTADAAFGLMDAAQVLNDPNASPLDRELAQEKKMEALKELARQEIAERRTKEDTAGGYLDQLDKRPALGVTREDIAQARKEAKEERQVQGRSTQAAVRQVFEGTPQQRAEALQKLQRNSGREVSAQPDKSVEYVKVAGMATDTIDNLDKDHQKAASSLMDLGRIENSSPTAKRLLENLKGNGDAGEDLYDAIKNGDKKQIEEYLKDPEYKKAINDSFKYMKNWSDRVRTVDAEQVLDIINQDPELFESMMERAREEDNKNREKVDGFVGDYLLRESDIKPAREALNRILPDSDRSFTAGDIDETDRKALQDALELDHLPEDARPLVKSLLEGKNLDREQVGDLRKIMNRSESERKQEALASLDQISFENLHLTLDFEHVKRALVSLENTDQVHKSLEDLTKTLTSDESSPEDKSKARQELLKHLKEMNDNVGDQVHPLSNEFANKFRENTGKSLEEVIENLEGADDAEALKIARELSGNLPNGRDRANEYRALRVVRDLKPSSSPEEFNLAKRKLEREIASSNLEEGAENKFAIAWRDWSASNQSIGEISTASQMTPLRSLLDSAPQGQPLSLEGQDPKVKSSLEQIKESGNLPENAQKVLDTLLSGKEISAAERETLSRAVGDPAKAAETAVEDLARQARDGNTFARTALSAVLVSGQDLTRIDGWLRNHTQVEGDKPVYVPDATGLSQETRDSLATKASEVILEFSKKDNLSSEETSAAALALSVEHSHLEGDPARDKSDLSENLYGILNNGVEGTSQKQTLEGIFEAFNSGADGTEALSEIYLKGANSPTFAAHFDTIVANAKSHDKAAIRVLAGVTAGMADDNRLANPKHYSFLGDGTDVSREKNSISKRAQNVLLELAKQPDMGDKIVEDILYINDLGKNDPRFIDGHRMLSTLGKIAGKSKNQDLVDRSLTAVREGVDRNKSDTSSEAYRSAMDGMFGMASHWDNSDVKRISSDVSDQIVRGLRESADQIPREVRDRLISTFVANVRGGEEIDFETRRNSVLAMGAMGKYLDSSQVRLLASFGGDERYSMVSQNLRAGLEEFGVNKETIDSIVSAEASGKDLAPLLKSAGLNDDQTRVIRNIINNTSSGEKILEDLSMNPKQITEFKAAVAQSLLTVLAKAPGESLGRIGPKEIAYEAFKNVKWPMSRGDILENFRGEYISSENSWPLRDALVKYFEGKPFNPELAQEINRIVDGAHLPRPAAAILMNLGVEGTDYRTKKPGDPDTVFEIADKIKEHYSKDGRDGEEVLRDVVSNIEMLNTLPGDRRARIMGWDQLSQRQKENMGWFDEPPASEKEKLNWDKLTEAQKERIRWDNVKIDPKQVIGQMQHGLLGETVNKVLLTDLNETLENEQREYHRQVQNSTYEIKRLTKVKEDALDKFVRLTKGKGSFGNKVKSFFTLNDGIDQELNIEQKAAASQIRVAGDMIEQEMREQSQAQRQASEIQLAQDVKRYTDLLNKGYQVEADRLALRMFEEHGPMLSQMAPSVWRDLTVSQDSTLQGASTLKRLRDRGLVQFEMIPGYTAGTRPDGSYDYGRARIGFEEALGLRPANNSQSLIDLKDSIHDGKEPFKIDITDGEATAPFRRALRSIDKDGAAAKLIGNLLDGKELSGDEKAQLKEALYQESLRGLLQLAPDDKFRDSTALRNHMIARLDQDQALKKFSDVSRKMSGNLNEFQRMYEAAMQGTIYDGSIKEIKQKAEEIKEALSSVTRQDLADVADRIKLMEKALEQMKSGDEPGNKKAMEELETRIKTYKKMHNMLNPDGPIYKEFATEDKENEGEYVNQNKQIMDMLDRVTEGGLTASTATNWFKENGPLIGATIVALAATAAACATFGTASPAAAAAWFAVIGLAAREVTNEIMFQVNENGYTGYGSYDNKGARIMDWRRNAMAGEFDGVDEALLALGTDVALPYGIELVRDYAAFLLTAGIMNKFVGGMPTKQALGSLFAKAPPNSTQLAFMSQRALMASQGRGVAGQFMRQFMRNFGTEMLQNVGMTGVQTGIETAVFQNLSAEQLEAMGEWGQFGLSFALSTGLAMGQGYGHSRMIQKATWQSGSKFRFKLADGVSESAFVQHMQKQGMNVEQISPGKWKVLPVGADANMVPITMEMMERGEGRPPAALHPEGKPLAMRETGPLPEQVQVRDGESWVADRNTKLMNDHVRKFNDLFMQGKFKEAYEFASQTLKGDKFQTTEFKPAAGEPDPTRLSLSELTELQTKAQSGDLQAQATLNSRMQDFMEGLANPDVSNVTAENGKVKATIPKIKLEVDGTVFDLASGKVLKQASGASDAQIQAATRQVEAFRNSAEGKRLMAEQALTAMEERIHLLHKSMGNPVMSSTYAEFIRDTAEPGSEQSSAIKNPEKRTQQSLEQETIMTLYESGWSIEHLEHHFSRHHKDIREPVFNYLRGREALKSIADPTVQERVTRLVSDPSLDPKSRQALYKDLPELVSRFEGGELVSRVDSLSYVNSEISPLLDTVSRQPNRQSDLKSQAAESVDALKTLIKQGKIDTDSAVRVVDLMKEVAGNSNVGEMTVMSKDVVEILAGLSQEQLNTIRNLDSSDKTLLVEALNLNLLKQSDLTSVLSDPAALSQKLQGMSNQISLVKSAGTNRSAEQIQRASQLSDKDQQLLKTAFESDDVSPQALDMLMNRMKGDTSGNQTVDGILAPDAIANASPAQLKEIGILLSKHLDGTLGRNPDVIKQLLDLKPEVVSDVSEMIQMKDVTNEHLNLILNDLSNISDPKSLKWMADAHKQTAKSDAALHRSILSINDRSIRKTLIEKYFSTSQGKVKAILKARDESPEMASLLDEILSRPSNKDENLNLANELATTELSKSEITSLAKTIKDGSISNDLVTVILNENASVRKSLIDLAASGKVSDTTLAKIANHDEAAFLTESLSKDTLDSARAEKLMELFDSDSSHAEYVKKILEEQNAATKPTLKLQELDALIADTNLAFDKYLDVPLDKHTNQDLVRAQRELRDIRNNLVKKNTEASTIESLNSLMKDELPRVYDSDFPWRREQLTDLVTRLKTTPEHADKLIGAFTGNPLRYGAYMNNPELISKPIDSFEVLARGETTKSGNLEDWTPQYETAARYYADHKGESRHLHLVVIQKDKVSPELWAWAKEPATGMDLNKKKSHWVDPQAMNPDLGEMEKTLPDSLKPALRDKAEHYYIDLD